MNIIVDEHDLQCANNIRNPRKTLKLKNLI